MHVLIVEDDRPIAENIYDFLETRGHQCDFACTLADAKRRLAHDLPDVIVLDRNLPDGDGLALLRDLRCAGKHLPVLVLTARDTLVERLLGFEAGADDYLAKPFALQEVEARLVALHRRAAQGTERGPVLRQGRLSYDPFAQELRLENQLIHLPPKAVKLVATLLEHPNRVFSRRELELAVWGHEQVSGDNLRSVLHTVRKTLGEESGLEVKNVHGLGYKLIDT